jgi:biopolymer transport protein ExbD
MVSTSFVQDQALNVALPQANGDARPAEEVYINIVVGRDGTYVIDGNSSLDGSLSGLSTQLRKVVKAKSQQSENLPVVISADANTTHQAVVRVMDACAQVGLSEISLATQPISKPSKE